MINIKIKALYECVELKKYKFSNFVHKFSEFHQSDGLSRFNCENIEDNLIKWKNLIKVILKIEL